MAATGKRQVGARSRRWIGVARIRFRTENGGLAAIAQAVAGPVVGPAELERLLADARVVHGIDADALRTFAERLADAAYAGSVVIARGQPPVPGADGTIDCSNTTVVAGELHRDGSIDFRERRFLVPVAEGSEIARFVAPTAGAPGRDVHGDVIAAKPGRPPRLRLGAGTRLDGEVVLATRSGVLLRDERVLDVVTLHTHGGDVDYTSGSLHTEGSLVVRGDVQAGFAADARGDVHVTGSVFEGTVRAGGTARIDQGVLGARASVRASGALLCRHATAAALHADGAIELFDQAVHCRLRARSVKAIAGHGALIGGEVRALTRIVARVAGTAGGATTHFVLGQDPAAAAGAAPSREALAGACVEVSDALHVGVRVTFGDRTWTADSTHRRVRLRWSPETGAIVVEPLP